MRWLAIGGGALAATVAAAGAYVYFAAPLDLVRDQLAREVKARTGRDLVIVGSPSLSFYPALAISLGEVSLSAPAGFDGPPTVRMRSLQARLALWPLLSQRVVVERLILEAPVIDLRIDRSGRQSWQQARTAGDGRIRLAQASALRGTKSDLPPDLESFARQSSPDNREANPAAAGGARRSAAIALDIRDVRIEQGAVTYTDERSGLTEALSGLDLAVTGQSGSAPLDGAGTLVWRGERISIAARLSGLEPVLAGQPFGVSLRTSARHGRLDFDGTIDGGRVAGRLAADAASLARLAQWIAGSGLDLAGLGGAAVEGELTVAGQDIALDTARLALGRHTASGRIGVRLAGARPVVRAALAIPVLDTGTLLDAAGASPSASMLAPLSGGASAGPSPATGAPRTIEDLIRRSGADDVGRFSPGHGATAAAPRVRGFTRREGWSESPIDLAVLTLLDANLDLQIGRIVHQQVKAGRTVLRVALANGALRADVDETSLYDGKARGVLTLARASGGAVVGATATIEQAAARPLLRDAAGFDWIEGQGRVALTLTGSGPSEAQIMRSLAGKADFTFTNGAIVGINIAQRLRALAQGQLGGLEKAASEKTDFSELSASFTVSGGIARNQDLRMLGPLVRVTGAGDVDLGQRQLAYTVRPKLVASLEGQGGRGDLTGLEVPVRITGPWDNPAVAPDLEALLKDPGKAIDAVKDIGKQIKKGGLGDIVRGLTGPGGSDRAKDLLNQLVKP